jgi:hypothetical protein
MRAQRYILRLYYGRRASVKARLPGAGSERACMRAQVSLYACKGLFICVCRSLYMRVWLSLFACVGLFACIHRSLSRPSKARVSLVCLCVYVSSS